MADYRLLIADEDEGCTNDLQRLFLGNPDFKLVRVVSDGGAALSFLSENEVHCIILDLRLREYDGYQVIQRVRKHNNAVRIIVTSELTGESFVNRAIADGADCFVAKPYAKAELHKKVSELLRAATAGTSRETVFRVGSVRSLDEKLSSILIQAGIPPQIKGYKYIREAVKSSITEPPLVNNITKKLYPLIAERFNASASKVERAIRHAIDVSWRRGRIDNINNYFGIKLFDKMDKPTNGELIALLADKLSLEMN